MVYICACLQNSWMRYETATLLSRRSPSSVAPLTRLLRKNIFPGDLLRMEVESSSLQMVKLQIPTDVGTGFILSADWTPKPVVILHLSALGFICGYIQYEVLCTTTCTGVCLSIGSSISVVNHRRRERDDITIN